MSAVNCSYSVAGSGPAVYFVHGIGSRKSTWNALIDGLQNHFTCVSYDLRGHGDSPIPEPPYTLEQLVEDLEALRARLGHDSIYVVGHSLGGMIGPAYARAYPERAMGVGLLSTAAGRTAEDSAGVKAVVSAMREKGVGPVLNNLVNRWFTDDFVERNPDQIEARLQQVMDTPENVFLSVFDVYANTEMAPWLSQVKCPCLVLTGELDGGCNPRLNQFIAGQLPDSQLVILDGLKHSIMIEASAQVLPHLKRFLLGCATD